MENVTIKDIAKLANVSVMTVSRALNDSPAVRLETKERVMEIARQLHYISNISAKSLVLHKSYTLALFFTSIEKGTSAQFFHDIVGTVSRYIPTEYGLVVKGIDECSPQLISKERFDGILFVSQSPKDDPVIENALHKDIPIVVLNRAVKRFPVVNILSSEEAGAASATEYLIAHGHRDIAIIKGIEKFESTAQRAEGFFRILQKHHISIPPVYSVLGQYDIQSGWEAMQQLLSLPKIPSAVFCSNDDMAVGAMKAISSHKMRVPDDISVIGFDDSIVCNYTSPALTSIQKPTRELSVMGIKKLMEMIDKKEENYRQIIYLSTTLIERESVRTLNQFMRC